MFVCLCVESDLHLVEPCCNFITSILVALSLGTERTIRTRILYICVAEDMNVLQTSLHVCNTNEHVSKLFASFFWKHE